MTYSQPETIGQALAILRQDAPKVIAGGTDVYPALKQGATPTAFLDTTRILGFKEITQLNGALRFGAALTWSDVVQAALPPAFDALKQAAQKIGSLQIQNAGTLAGNICNASPAADGMPALLALDAQVELNSEARGSRVMPLSSFVTGVRQTALAPDELLTAIIVPKQPEGMTSAFEKLGARRYLVISISMVAANLLLGADGRIEEARIAVGACSAVAQRLSDLEADLLGADPRAVRVREAHLRALSPIDDVRGSGAFRLQAVKNQIERAIAKAGQR